MTNETWRLPTISETDKVIFTEEGRILDKVDYNSYCFHLVQEKYGPLALLVKHGGGEERLRLNYSRYARLENALAAMDSDTRYYFLFTLYKTASEAERNGAAETTRKLYSAFAEGRLKKRKIRNSSSYKITIEPKIHNT